MHKREQREQQGTLSRHSSSPLLDDNPDGNRDDVDSPVSPETRMLEGKYKKQQASFSEIYMNDKDYVSWVRNHIRPSSSRMIREFKVYIAHRDQGNGNRIKGQRVQQAIQMAAGARPKSSGRKTRRADGLGDRKRADGQGRAMGEACSHGRV